MPRRDAGPFALPDRPDGDRFRRKDTIVSSILEKIDVLDPTSYRAILMPCLYGPELAILDGKGVPRSNLFAIERDPEVYKIQKDPPPGMEHLRGIRVPPRPMDAPEAIDHAHLTLGNANLAYFDFFGQPTLSHYTLLFKVFRLRLLSPGAVLITTFGDNQGSPFACRVNALVATDSVARAYVRGAAEQADHPLPVRADDHSYVSNRLKYVTTEFRFP